MARQRKVWDAATGAARLTLHGHTGAVAGVAFSPDGRRLAATDLRPEGRRGVVKVWEALPRE